MPGPMIPTGPDPASVAWNRVFQHSNSLFDALEALDEVGGTTRAAAIDGWGGKRQEKALATMLATHEALGREIARLDSRCRHDPARRRRIG